MFPTFQCFLCFLMFPTFQCFLQILPSFLQHSLLSILHLQCILCHQRCTRLLRWILQTSHRFLWILLPLLLRRMLLQKLPLHHIRKWHQRCSFQSCAHSLLLTSPCRCHSFPPKHQCIFFLWWCSRRSRCSILSSCFLQEPYTLHKLSYHPDLAKSVRPHIQRRWLLNIGHFQNFLMLLCFL